MNWHKMPIFRWSLYATSVILRACDAGLGDRSLLVGVERIFHIGIFDPAVDGDPLLFQHLFWFYSHPAVYIMILPGLGVVSEIFPASPENALRLRIRRLGQHLDRRDQLLCLGPSYVCGGESRYSAVVFSILTFLVAVPSAIKVFNWVATMHKGYIHFDAPMLYAMASSDCSRSVG